MTGWRTMPLGDLAESVDYGVTASASQRPIGPKFLRITDIQDGIVSWESVPWCKCDERSASESRLRSGDIVFARTGATTGKSFLIRECPPNAVFASYLIRVRLGEKAEPGFVSRFFQTQNYWAQITKSARGLAQPGVNASTLKALRVPLPPLPEQRRIAEILDKADALRAKRRAALAQLDTLTQSIFLDMFGDPATNPKGWPVKRIEDVTECLDRLRRPVTESDRKPGNVPYYGANGQQGWIDTALFDEPLVLVAEDGGYFDAPERGVAYRIDGPAWVNNHAHILRAIPTHVDTEFLHRALRHFNFSPFISGTTRAKLTQGQLNAVKLFVPPLELQREFGERVAGAQRVAQVTASSGDQLDALFASLQHRAFRGEL